MVKVTILIGFLASFVSAIPTLLDEFQTHGSVTSCKCGTTTGYFCGERSGLIDAPISGECNTTSLYLCTPWSAKTAGVADLVQGPCWTGECHQHHYTKTGLDSCTVIETAPQLSDHKSQEKVVNIRAINTESKNQESSERSATPSIEITPMKACSCGDATGHFCGSRAAEGNNKAVSGGCNPLTLYYCSPWAVNTTGLADVVNEPCWTQDCHESSKHGDDSCTKPQPPARSSTSPSLAKHTSHTALYRDEAPKPKTESKAPASPSSKFDDRDKAASPQLYNPGCMCGTRGGYFCGARTRDPRTQHDPESISGDCDANTLYACGNYGIPEAIAWANNQCFSSPSGKCFVRPAIINGIVDDVCYENMLNTLFTYESEVSSRSEVAHRHLIQREPSDNKSKPPPDCTCTNNIKGYVCGSRDRFSNDHKQFASLGGDCPTDSLYYCPAGLGEKALVVQDKCPYGPCQLNISQFSYADNCAGTANAIPGS